MAEIIETTVYQMEELSDDAKEKARDWYREGAFDHDWYWAVYADFEQICEILGIALASVPVRLHGGGTRRKPCIWFSGFASQGDGACFEGDYSYARGCASAIRSYAPKDQELHRIADALLAIQWSNFFQLSARVIGRGSIRRRWTRHRSPFPGAPWVTFSDMACASGRRVPSWRPAKASRPYCRYARSCRGCR